MHVDTRMACALAAATILAGCAAPTPNDGRANAAAAVPAARTTTCLTSTGSRIPVTDDRYCTAMGQSYSQQDISGTGKSSSTSQALQMLDPAILNHH